MNKNMSESYKEAYGQEAKPSAGTSVPAGKDRDEKDTLKAKHTVEAVRDAKDVAGACQRANDKQQGKARDDMTQKNSGCDCGE